MNFGFVINLNRKKVIAIIFTIMITLCGILTGLFGAREIGYNMLVGYKENLPENPSAISHVNGIIDSTENGLNRTFIFKNGLINLFGSASKVMNKRVIMDVSESNTVYKLKNGQITFINQEYDVTNQVNSMIELNSFLSGLDIPLVYVQAPFKINKYDNQLPYGMEDYSNKNSDVFLTGINKAGVKSLDLREKIKNMNLDYSSLFFNTDHHWKPEAGLWASSVIVEMLNEEYGFNIDKNQYDISNYKIKTYENWFLGSQGKRVGVGYAGVDNFNLITPKFNTNIEFYIDSLDLVRKGNFSETLLFMENLEPNEVFNADPYSVYTGGNYPLNIIKNKNSLNDEKVLLLKDSFSQVVTPFLSLSSKELHTIDLRYFDEMSLREYVKELLPSVVVVLYNPGALVDNKSLFEFD